MRSRTLFGKHATPSGYYKYLFLTTGVILARTSTSARIPAQRASIYPSTLAPFLQNTSTPLTKGSRPASRGSQMMVLTWTAWLWSSTVMSARCELFRGERTGSFSERLCMQLRSKLESSQGDTFSSSVIADSLYGSEDGSDLAPSMDEINCYVQLKKWSSAQWADLLHK